MARRSTFQDLNLKDNILQNINAFCFRNFRNNTLEGKVCYYADLDSDIYNSLFLNLTPGVFNAKNAVIQSLLVLSLTS